MNKIINAHCHIYPKKIASKAVEGIRDFYDMDLSLNGVSDDLIKDGESVGVVHYLVHSVATTPKQVTSINEFISSEVQMHPDLFTGFGSLHPKSKDIASDIDYLINLGLKGVKLHPDFQRFALNDNDGLKIGEAIDDANIPVLIHCGDYRYNYSNPDQLKEFLEHFSDLTVIGAHFAGWSVWDEAIDKLSDYSNLYVDTSSSFYEVPCKKAEAYIDAYGVDKVLWGTDYPMWDSKTELERFNKLDLTKSEKSKILYENAVHLLKIK